MLPGAAGAKEGWAFLILRQRLSLKAVSTLWHYSPSAALASELLVGGLRRSTFLLTI